MRYQYTGDQSAVTPFQHGQEGVTLIRNRVAYFNDEALVETGSIIIEPFDFLEVNEPIVHAHFLLLDDGEPSPWAALGKPELLAEAGKRSLNVTSRTSKPDLVAALDAFDADSSAKAASAADQEAAEGSGAAKEPTPEASAEPFAVGDTVWLSAAGRELLGDTDALGEVIAVGPNDVNPGPSVVVRWQDGTESYPSLSLIELAADPDSAAAVSTTSETRED